MWIVQILQTDLSGKVACVLGSSGTYLIDGRFSEHRAIELARKHCKMLAYKDYTGFALKKSDSIAKRVGTVRFVDVPKHLVINPGIVNEGSFK